MKTYISDIIPKLQAYSKKLDEETLLTKQHWVAIDETSNSKNVYIFRKNNELLISQNGKVEKAKWEYLGHNSLLIDRKDESYLYKHGFFDENILALKVDSTNEFAILVNEIQFETGLNTIAKINGALTQKYIRNSLVDPAGKTRNAPPISNSTQYLEEKLIDGRVIKIEYKPPYSFVPDVDVFDQKGNPLTDGNYFLTNNKVLSVKNGKIFKRYFLESYKIKGLGVVRIRQVDVNGPQPGDEIFDNSSGTTYISGEFRLSWATRVVFDRGIIKKVKLF